MIKPLDIIPALVFVALLLAIIGLDLAVLAVVGAIAVCAVLALLQGKAR